MIALIFFCSLSIVAVWESWRPRRRPEFPSLRRRFGNIGFWLINLVIGAIILGSPNSVRPLLRGPVIAYLPSWPFANAILSFATGFLLLDLISYSVHRWQHAAPFLWRFHAVHHSDPDVDVTTSVRHHPIEYLIAGAIYWVAVVVLDIPAAVTAAHAASVFAAAAVTHGNICLPESLERRLQPLIITVDLHLLHHSIDHEEANSNFGAVLSIWDRLFGTFMPVSPVRRGCLSFGIPGLPQRQCLSASIMIMPWLLKRIATGSD